MKRQFRLHLTTKNANARQFFDTFHFNFCSLSFLVPSIEQILEASIAGIKRNKQDESKKRKEKE